jgi:hypothetical protein
MMKHKSSLLLESSFWIRSRLPKRIRFYRPVISGYGNLLGFFALRSRYSIITHSMLYDVKPSAQISYMLFVTSCFETFDTFSLFFSNCQRSTVPFYSVFLF